MPGESALFDPDRHVDCDTKDWCYQYRVLSPINILNLSGFTHIPHFLVERYFARHEHKTMDFEVQKVSYRMRICGDPERGCIGILPS
jgi:hypothetical protein